jgi:3',5'-cyclic-AMP phosphodiesterase
MKFSPIFRFAVASDGHYGEPGVEADKNYLNLISWLREEKRTHGLDVWFFNGDMIHDALEYVPKIREFFDSVNVPYYVIRGNHDIIPDDEWENFFGYKVNFEARMKEILFLGGSTSDSQGNYHCADTRWFSERLNAGSRQQLIFIFLHISQGGWTEQGIYCPDVIKLFDQHPEITAVFHGHDHREDHVKQSENTPFFFDGYIGSTWGLDYYGYRIVEIDAGYHVRTYQFDPLRLKIVNENYI